MRLMEKSRLSIVQFNALAVLIVVAGLPFSIAIIAEAGAVISGGVDEIEPLQDGGPFNYMQFPDQGDDDGGAFGVMCDDGVAYDGTVPCPYQESHGLTHYAGDDWERFDGCGYEYSHKQWKGCGNGPFVFETRSFNELLPMGGGVITPNRPAPFENQSLRSFTVEAVDWWDFTTECSDQDAFGIYTAHLTIEAVNTLDGRIGTIFEGDVEGSNAFYDSTVGGVDFCRAGITITVDIDPITSMTISEIAGNEWDNQRLRFTFDDFKNKRTATALNGGEVNQLLLPWTGDQDFGDGYPMSQFLFRYEANTIGEVENNLAVQIGTGVLSFLTFGAALASTSAWDPVANTIKQTTSKAGREW